MLLILPPRLLAPASCLSNRILKSCRPCCRTLLRPCRRCPDVSTNSVSHPYSDWTGFREQNLGGVRPDKGDEVDSLDLTTTLQVTLGADFGYLRHAQAEHVRAPCLDIGAPVEKTCGGASQQADLLEGNDTFICGCTSAHATSPRPTALSHTLPRVSAVSRTQLRREPDTQCSSAHYSPPSSRVLWIFVAAAMSGTSTLRATCIGDFAASITPGSLLRSHSCAWFSTEPSRSK